MKPNHIQCHLQYCLPKARKLYLGYKGSEEENKEGWTAWRAGNIRAGEKVEREWERRKRNEEWQDIREDSKADFTTKLCGHNELGFAYAQLHFLLFFLLSLIFLQFGFPAVYRHAHSGWKQLNRRARISVEALDCVGGHCVHFSSWWLTAHWQTKQSRVLAWLWLCVRICVRACVCVSRGGSMQDVCANVRAVVLNLMWIGTQKYPWTPPQSGLWALVLTHTHTQTHTQSFHMLPAFPRKGCREIIVLSSWSVWPNKAVVPSTEPCQQQCAH